MTVAATAVEKGEFTVVLGPRRSLLFSSAPAAAATEEEGPSSRSAEEECRRLLERLRDDGVARSEAVRLVVEMKKSPKSFVYRIALGIEWT